MMINLIRGEHIKQRHDRIIIGLCISVLVMISFMTLFSTVLSNGENHQVVLHHSDKAGYYGLFFFTTVLRRLFGLIYGYHVIDMELINNRQDFFIQNTGRVKMIIGKIIYGFLLLFIMNLFIYFIPFIISGLIYQQFHFDILAINQIFFIWLITIGNMLLGMILRFIFNEFLLFTIAITLLEFFSTIFPQFIIDIWTRCDGLFYLSKSMMIMKNELKELKNYIIVFPHTFEFMTGIIIWIIILVLIIMVIISIIKRKELTK